MYTRGQVIEFIEKVFGSSIASNGGLNISVTCPNCLEEKGNTNKKKFAIKTDTFVAHCWSCDYRTGNIFWTIKKYHPEYLDEFTKQFLDGKPLNTRNCIVEPNLKEEIVEKILASIEARQAKSKQKEAVKLPADFTLLAQHLETFEDAPWYIREAIRYLVEDRNVTYQDFWYFGFGVSQQDEYRNRVIIPSFNEEGTLNYLTARTWKERVNPKYFNPDNNVKNVVFCEHHIDWSQPLILVEGPFDLVKSPENTTALLGSALEKDYVLFQKIVHHKTPVILCLDPDALKKTYSIAQMLFSYEVPVSIIHLPKGYKDVGMMTKEEVAELIPTAKPYRFTDSLNFKLYGTGFYS